MTQTIIMIFLMIETAGLGIAMGNAPTDVKDCANAVTYLMNKME